MADEMQAPFVVKVCQAMISLAAYLVPASMRTEWKREWIAKIWHQWQFLFYVKEWNGRESWQLFRTCKEALSNAAWHFRSYPELDKQRREWIRSPWTTISVLLAGLLLIGCLSSGFSATRLLLTGASQEESQQVFLWMHSLVGARDKGLPADVVPAWSQHSKLLEAVAPFNIDRNRLTSPELDGIRPLVVETQASLFQVLQAQPFLGHLPQAPATADSLVVDYATWKTLAKNHRPVIGSRMKIGSAWVPVTAVLPKHFYFLSRQPSVFLVRPALLSGRVMVAARAQKNVSRAKLYRELLKVAETDCYYFLAGQLRLEYLSHVIWAPVQFFGTAVLVAVLMVVCVCRIRFRRIRRSWMVEHRTATLRRGGYFLGKTILALLVVLFAGLEWSRPEAAILFASKDPASGLLLVWFFVVSTIGVLFWAIADQRARCQECQRLLCSPVRIGCPGCLLLDWSGTELLCSEGHGVLHVPELASSWDIDAEHWISLDDSWRDLFADTKER